MIRNMQKTYMNIVIYLTNLFCGEIFILRKAYKTIIKGTKTIREMFLSMIEFKIYNCKYENGGT